MGRFGYYTKNHKTFTTFYSCLHVCTQKKHDVNKLGSNQNVDIMLSMPYVYVTLVKLV